MTTVPDRRELQDRNLRRLIIAMAVLILTAATTATGLYSYPETLGPIRVPMIVIHDACGDIALLLSGIYLNIHLRRTWRMKRLTLSRYSGLVVVGIWGVAGVTGIYGHFFPLEQGGWWWRLHFWPSLATIVIVSFHGAWAYRPRRSA